MFQVILFVMVALCSVWTVVGFVSVLRLTRRSRAQKQLSSDHPRVPITVLKPLCGADPGLYANLESFFRQSYPDFELVFGVQNPNDLAIEVVRKLNQAYPGVRTKLVVHDTQGGMNPKVRNLLGMLPHASFDLLLISDSNVRAPEHYLEELLATRFSRDRVGLVTNLFAGEGEDVLGAALENVQLNGFCAAGLALPTSVGSAAVVGKSMLLSRSEFERLGGFDRVANVLAEDFVIGKMYQHAGYRVRIAPTVLANVTSRMSLKAFIDRHLRWAMLRWRLQPVAYFLEPLTSPLALLPAALLLFGASGVLWTLGLLLLRDLGGWVALRGWRRAALPVLLSPVRELVMLLVWLRAPMKRHVSWRGTRVRLGAGTLLYEQRP